MDVKIAFLNGYVTEGVYVEQPPSFENSDILNHVYKLEKALTTLNKLIELGIKDWANFFGKNSQWKTWYYLYYKYWWE